MIDLATLTRASFEPHVGERFVMHVSPTLAIALELIAVDALPTPHDARRTSFALRFRAAGPGHVPQRIYRVEHPIVGALDIFLVPLGPDAVGMRYEAIFS